MFVKINSVIEVPMQGIKQGIVNESTVDRIELLIKILDSFQTEELIRLNQWFPSSEKRKVFDGFDKVVQVLKEG